jgi:hypothetical protein
MWSAFLNKKCKTHLPLTIQYKRLPTPFSYAVLGVIYRVLSTHRVGTQDSALLAISTQDSGNAIILSFSPSCSLTKQSKQLTGVLSHPKLLYVKCCMSNCSWARYARPNTILNNNYIEQIAPFQVLYVKFVFGSLSSPSYHFRQQNKSTKVHHLKSCVCPIFLRLPTLALIQFKRHLNRTNCTISSVVCRM